MRAKAVIAALIPALIAAAPARAVVVDFVRPVVGPVARHFEPPPTPYAAGHRGIDLEVPAGTTVVAAAAGTVAFAGQVGGTYAVSIDHADGLRTTYSYLSAVLVRAGDPVAQGAPVAVSGVGHGGEAPPVLHFGLRRGSEYLDPEPILVESMRRNRWRVIRLAPPA
ncbi:MAG: M23 family metallopeptidase [Actinomycetota bacterium]